MKTILSPKEFDDFLSEFDHPTGVKITLVSSKISDLKLEQELLINKIEEENTNNTKDMVLLAKYVLLTRHLKKVLNALNKNFLEG